MKGESGKAPTVQWYYKDWLSDRKLQRAHPSSRGVWMNLLMHMVDCSTDKDGCREGILEDITIPELMQLGACDEGAAWQFIEDALKHGFCNIELDKNRTFHIMSRRLSRDAERRKYWRKKKQLQREREGTSKESPTIVPPVSRRTPIPTPSPSPTSKNIKTYNTAKKSKGSQIPDDFLLDEQMKQYALDRKIDPTKVEDLFESFRDYHEAKGSVMKNWRAAWQNWVRNAQEFSKWAIKEDDTDDRVERILAKRRAAGEDV